MNRFDHLNEQAMARLALSCLDLTELGEACNVADVQTLCNKAMGHVRSDRVGHAPDLPPVAAVCVWPAFVAQARTALPKNIRVAAVVNFPGGQQSMDEVRAQVQQIQQGGGQEVDSVLPYRAWLAGEHEPVRSWLRSVRQASSGLSLKLILESGAFTDDQQLRAACEMALDEGVDFLKTSTGKIPQGASLDAAHVLLSSITAHPARDRLGFKPSGGIRTVSDVRAYAQAVQDHLGPNALVPERFRIGASGLWSDIARVLGAQATTTVSPTTY